MDYSVHNKLVSFIWSIADDCLRDVYVRGKYRDVILPMVVLRRLDTLLEPTKAKVLEEVRFQKEELEFTELDSQPFENITGYVFYNTSKWTLKTLYQTASNTPQYMLANFEEYLDGFSDNVQEIINCFKLREQIRHMSHKNVLLGVLEKFVSPYINLTPQVQTDPEGNKLPALTNLGMGYVFEELIRKFNEENNEEAGEHFTPREVIELMTHLVFDPLKQSIPAIITIYDPACGSGGMLTESQNFIEEKYPLGSDFSRSIYLFGKETNDETYAICKSDMMIKGNNPENIKNSSTLETDTFQGQYFDFMLANPPYGKSLKKEELNSIKDGNSVIDDRFKVSLSNYWGTIENMDAVPRSSDGQLLFLMEMVNKMKSPKDNLIGSRIASVHNGSSLFTGDAGSGESNIRRYIIENDLLDAIVQLPNNLFYNTGITTYIWLLNNNKPQARQGKVQLIDASLLFRKLRKNLGDKNCEFASEHIAEITQNYLAFAAQKRQSDEQGEPFGIASQIFDNQDFGYYKITIERPDRRSARFTAENIASLRFDKALSEPMQYLYQQYGEQIYQAEVLAKTDKEITAWCEEQGIALNNKAKAKLLDIKTWQKSTALFNTATQLLEHFGERQFDDFNVFKQQAENLLKAKQIKLSATEKNAIFNAVSWYNETAEKVIAKTVKLKPNEKEALCRRYQCRPSELADFGYFPTEKAGEFILYEASSDLRDSESVPLKQRIHDYFKAEVQPHADEAWLNMDSIKIGYEISFNKYFYRHKPLRTLSEVAQDILALERQADGLIGEILAD